MSSKKTDLKDELADILMSNEDSENSISKILKDDAVMLGTPDHTLVMEKKRAKALEDKRKRETSTQEVALSTQTIKPAGKSELNSGFVAPPTVAQTRVAQNKIEQLEQENDTLRNENQMLDSSTTAMRSQIDEMTKRLIDWEKRYKDMAEKKDLELEFAREELGHKTVKLEEATKQLEELESRFEGEFHRIRTRERELQNRLDILKHEGNAISRNKDDLILELKRQIEKLNYEMDGFRKKNQGVYGQVELQQDRIKRAMKALRVAVNLLDGEEDKPLKKAE